MIELFNNNYLGLNFFYQDVERTNFNRKEHEKIFVNFSFLFMNIMYDPNKC